MPKYISYPLITYNEFLILLAFEKKPRNKSQVAKAIEYCLGKELHKGRVIFPGIEILATKGYLERVNPYSSNKSGHIHKITEEGREAIKEYYNCLSSISEPRFGF